MSARDKRRLLLCAFLVGFICVSMVVMRAYASELQCENNEILSVNEQLQGDIDTLGVKISTANNASNIEAVAMKKIGMEYPTAENCVELKDSDRPKANFAAVIKKEAFN